MAMCLEPMWTSISDMLSSCTYDQLLKWKEVAENPRVDNYRSITTLRQLVVGLYNKSIKDIINKLSSAVDNEFKLRGNNMDKKLEARICRLEKLFIKNESEDVYSDMVYRTVNQLNDTLQSMFDNLMEAHNEGNDMSEAIRTLRFIKRSKSIPEGWRDRFDALIEELSN